MRIIPDQKLILGPPGCGKTTRCLAIIDEELQRGVPPRRIAYVSFTRKAVGEAVERAALKFGLAQVELPFFKTLHALCFRVLNVNRKDVMSHAQYSELGAALGYRFSTNNAATAEDGLTSLSNEGDRLLFIDQLARSRCVTLDEQWHELNDSNIDLFALKRLRQALVAYKRDTGKIDYTDMLQGAIDQNHALDIDVVVIDEAQDLSPLQWAVCKVLFRDAQRVYIAGDDDQAIYRWSGADVEQFLTLEGQTEVLGMSYRLPRAVYRAAVDVIERVKQRFAKAWQPRDDEGSVQSLPHVELIDFTVPGTWLILARNAYLLTDTEMLLRKAGVLFITRKGTSSVDPEHYDAIRTWERLRKGEPQPGSRITNMYDCLRPGSGIKRGARAESNFRPDAVYSDQDLRTNHGLLATGIWHDALEGIALNTREYYLTVLRAGRKLSAAPQVQLSTIHAAKGGEADNVALLTDMAQKTFQGYQKSPDDEQRTFYVGMTRAKRNLFLIDSKSQQGFSV